MNSTWKKRLLLLIFCLLPLLLSGCWDTHELDKMFIVTGIALDQAKDGDQLDITLQVEKTKASQSGSGEASPPENPTFLLKGSNDTVMGSFMAFNRDGGYRLMLNHNQVFLVGLDFAAQGLEKRLDLFVRDQQARLEVPFVIVDGRAETALSAQLSQEGNTGIFFANVFQDLSSISKKYEVRLVDFVSRLLNETAAPIVPIIQVVKGVKGDEIKMSGMAVFQGDRMIGRLSNDEVLGYVWAMGNVRKSYVTASNSLGKATFYINRLDCKKKVKLRDDGGISLTLDTDASLTVSEISGFRGISQEELLPILKKLAEDEIQSKITGTLQTACELKADIYDFGKFVHNQYPKEWKTLSKQWTDLFADMEYSVAVNVSLPSVGKSLQGLEMSRNHAN